MKPHEKDFELVVEILDEVIRNIEIRSFRLEPSEDREAVRRGMEIARSIAVSAKAAVKEEL